jgi:hypothetical protein
VTGPLALATWLGLAPAAHAQAEPLEPGREVRLFVRGVANTFEGTLTAVSAESLSITLRDGSSFTFSPGQLERSEVRTSRPNTLLGAIVGGGAGLGVGVALVVTDDDGGTGSPTTAPDDEFGASVDAWKLIVPPIGGAILGAFAGRQIRTPRWAPGLLATGAAAPGDFAFGWSVHLGR